MLTVVYILCAVIGAFFILNAVLVITLHTLNKKFAKKHENSVGNSEIYPES